MQEREQEDRKRQVEYANRDNEDRQKQHKRDMEDYKRKLDEYHKELKAKCYSCSSTPGSKKCGVCNVREIICFGSNIILRDAVGTKTTKMFLNAAHAEEKEPSFVEIVMEQL